MASTIRVVPRGDEQQALGFSRSRTGYIELRQEDNYASEGIDGALDVAGCKSIQDGLLAVQIRVPNCPPDARSGSP